MVVYARAQIISAPAQLITAPAQPPATGAVVYTALFFHNDHLLSMFILPLRSQRLVKIEFQGMIPPTVFSKMTENKPLLKPYQPFNFGEFV